MNKRLSVVVLLTLLSISSFTSLGWSQSERSLIGPVVARRSEPLANVLVIHWDDNSGRPIPIHQIVSRGSTVSSKRRDTGSLVLDIRGGGESFAPGELLTISSEGTLRVHSELNDQAAYRELDRITTCFHPFSEGDRDAIRKLLSPRRPDTQLRQLRIGIKRTGTHKASVTTSFWINNTYFKVRHVVEKRDTEWVKTNSSIISEVRL